jgi:hypothetical protein
LVALEACGQSLAPFSPDIIRADIEFRQRPIVGGGVSRCQAMSRGDIQILTCTWGGRQQP